MYGGFTLYRYGIDIGNKDTVEDEHMEYRKLSKGNEKISVIGMGTSVIGETGEEEIVRTVNAALEAGINFFDLATDYPVTFSAFGKALEGRREKVYLQVHFGADYSSGEYGWSIDIDDVKANFKMEMEALRTDYIDFAMIHCMDEMSDFEEYKKNGVLDFIIDLKENGIVRHIGLATHTIDTANTILDMGLIDVMMFSLNPAYDYRTDQGYSSIERQQLYERCEREGVGITVMKAFCGGQLLDIEQSPFSIELSRSQCIQYALDKPSVLCVLPGCNNEKEVDEVIEYLTADEEERDYSIIESIVPDETKYKCVYCMHCHPCPAGLDVALINKYYELALTGDILAKEHYRTLDKKAGDCIHCGHCDSRCPFNVKQDMHMKEIFSYFGE